MSSSEALAWLAVEAEEEEPLDPFRRRVIIMRRRNLEISVLSVLALSSLDSNKDAHFVCVASRCQGRPIGLAVCHRFGG